jgi:hypothetical protein
MSTRGGQGQLGNGYLRAVHTTDSRSVKSVGFNYKPGGDDNPVGTGQ